MIYMRHLIAFLLYYAIQSDNRAHFLATTFFHESTRKTHSSSFQITTRDYNLYFQADRDHCVSILGSYDIRLCPFVVFCNRWMDKKTPSDLCSEQTFTL